ncbi:MAG: hypothetical protein ACO1PM_24885 [Acidovorax sp.]
MQADTTQFAPFGRAGILRTDHCASAHPTAPPIATDANLPEPMARVALQDRAAFKSLYQATCGSLFAVALRTLHNENWADDALQEVYMNI